ncbi:MAG: hypothetical protein DRZ76_03485 [Candidatus Nealsonbacteria bacterium]|nr:MAG: hypothetical protein DRZ76_03485 [Candidatus Nealsonbacteria bacterium]
MAKTGDVMFTLSATEYNYMLAVDANGRKRWNMQQLFTQPPSLIKNKIDMVIQAAPSMRQADGTVISTRDIATVLGELRTLADSTSVITLDGLEDQTYNVLFDQRATNARSIVDETGRIVQYEIEISCWDIYQAS